MARTIVLTEFGRRVRDERERRALSQERLGELACLHRTYIGVRVGDLITF
jgi:ribosome-binding protein aMBF1 (putative translation factor)